MKKLNTSLSYLILAMSSATAAAGDWFEDWEYNYTISTTNTVYGGTASCNAPYTTENGLLRYQTLEADVEDTYKSKVYLIQTTYGFYYDTKEPNPAYGDSYCEATLKPIRYVPTSYYWWYEPIPPYPGAVEGERLGCINSNQRKVQLSLPYVNGASNMKIYAQTAPNYPEVLVYTGKASNSLLVKVGASSDIIYIRTKLDNGSSHYLQMNNMSCRGGGGVPLN